MFEWISKLLGIGQNVTDPKHITKKEIDRYQYRIEAALEYLEVDRRVGEYKNITDEKQEQLKIHFSKRIKDAN